MLNNNISIHNIIYVRITANGFLSLPLFLRRLLRTMFNNWIRCTVQLVYRRFIEFQKVYLRYLYIYLQAHNNWNLHTHITLFINIHIHIYIHIYRYIHTFIHTYIDTHIHTYIHRYMHTYIYTYIHKYPQSYIHKYIYNIHVYTYMHKYKHTYIFYTSLNACTKATKSDPKHRDPNEVV